MKKIPEWEPTLAIAETISCERDHECKTSGVPLVVVSAMRVFKSHSFLKIHNLIKRQKSFFKISVAESTNDQSNLRGRMIERPGARRRPQDQVPSKVPSRKGWAKNNKYQREAGPEGQDLQVPLKTSKIKSGQRQGGRGRRALPRPIGLNPVTGCVPPFFPFCLEQQMKSFGRSIRP